MRLTTSNTNSKVEGIVTSSAEATFYSEGTLDNTQETTLSVKNLEVGNIESSESRTLTDVDVDTDVSVSSFTTRSAQTTSRTRSTTRVTQIDPLAQSFYVDDETGIFLSSIDVFFQSKPTTARTPVICQLREMELGTPTTRILPYSNVEVDPITITTS